MSCLRDAWRSTIDNLKFLTMKKFFFIITAICLSCAALMAEPDSVAGDGCKKWNEEGSRLEHIEGDRRHYPNVSER